MTTTMTSASLAINPGSDASSSMEDRANGSDSSSTDNLASSINVTPEAGGVGGGTNYRKWDTLSRSLLTDLEKQEDNEKRSNAQLLGHDRIPRSQADADERMKLDRAKQTKAVLDAHRDRETGCVLHLDHVFDSTDPSSEQINNNDKNGGDVNVNVKDNINNKKENHHVRVVEITQKHFGEHSQNLESRQLHQLEEQQQFTKKRVLSIQNTHGPGTIILSSDLSNLTSFQSTPTSSSTTTTTTTPPDAPAASNNTSIHGIIKLFLSNVHDCTIHVQCKIITRCLDISHCSNIHVIIESPPGSGSGVNGLAVSTVQCDLSNHVILEFIGYDPLCDQLLFGSTKSSSDCSKRDRIYHAGVRDLKVIVRRKSGKGKRMEKTMDFVNDGAVAEGSATAEEYQFVTHVVGGELVTERVLRLGNNSLMTERELCESQKMQETISTQHQQHEQEKEGQQTLAMTNPVSAVHDNRNHYGDDNHVDEEIWLSCDGKTTLTRLQRDDIIQTCEKHKFAGNEAFEMGEYAQAVLLYTLAIDKSEGMDDVHSRERGVGGAENNAEVGDGNYIKSDDGRPNVVASNLFSARHVCFANRSACFLKLGHHDKALDDAVMCTSLDPLYIKGHFRRGLALHALHRYDEAIPYFARALKMEPKNKQIRQALQFAEVKQQMEMRKRME